jgi:electron transport complex protein RnfB
VEIEILKYLFSPMEARVALCLTLRQLTVGTVRKRLKKKFGIELSADDASAQLHGMFLKGVIRASVEEGPPRYGIAMLAIGMFEYHVDDLTPELVGMMHRYFDEAFGDEFFRSALPQLRTSPHAKAVVPEYAIATYDNVREIIKNTKKQIHVANCVCKQAEALLGKPCKRTENIEVCLMFGPTAYAARNRARPITKKECLEIIDMAEAKGLVLQPGNTRDPFCLCICCGCCCGVLTNAKKHAVPSRFFASNYYAVIDKDLCIGCGICLTRCQMDALVERGGKVAVDLERCIGCGLCVTKCPAGAAGLKQKSKKTVPPKNVELLYLSILMDKAGKKKMMLNMLKLLLGRPL